MVQRSAPYPGAQAVGRAVAILKAFSDAQPRLTLAEISRTTRLNRATAYRLVSALEQEGLIARAAGDEAYQLGPEAIALGGRALRANALRPASRLELEALAQATHETATLEILVDRDILILDEVVSPHLVAGAPSLGTRWPAHATSTGKALLAFAPEAELSAFLRRSLAAFTPHTLSAPDALRAALAEVRRRGWATVGAGGPSLRLSPERLAETAPRGAEAARRVSDRLGYRPALKPR